MSHKTAQKITVEQENAIDLLLTGASDNDVAKQVGVTRETVCRWRNDNNLFIVELNKRRQALWGNSLDKLRSLIPQAIDVVMEHLNDDDNLAAAIHILKCVGLYGSLDFFNPDRLPKSEKEIAVATKEKEADLNRKEMIAGLDFF